MTNEKIIEVGKKLFAQKGYHGVSTREVAQFLGINISTFHYHTGGKSNLYKSVIESVYLRELEIFHEPISEFSSEDFHNPDKVRNALYEALLGFFEQMSEDRDRSFLYVRRWLEWPDEFTDQEIKNTLETFKPFYEFLEKAKEAGTIQISNPSIFLRAFLWMIYCYNITGIIDWKKWISNPKKKKNKEMFKQFLIEFIDKMLFSNSKFEYPTKELLASNKQTTKGGYKNERVKNANWR